jgi:hypothetical protein
VPPASSLNWASGITDSHVAFAPNMDGGPCIGGAEGAGVEVGTATAVVDAVGGVSVGIGAEDEHPVIATSVAPTRMVSNRVVRDAACCAASVERVCVIELFSERKRVSPMGLTARNSRTLLRIGGGSRAGNGHLT